MLLLQVGLDIDLFEDFEDFLVHRKSRVSGQMFRRSNLINL